MSNFLIFVSYSRKDEQFVDKISAELTANAFNVWVDRYKIEPGQAWATQLQIAIRTAEMVLFVHSSHSEQSEWVEKELSLAKIAGKLIVPIKIDSAPIQIIQVVNIQYIDFFKGYDNAFDALVNFLKTKFTYPADSNQHISVNDLKIAHDYLSRGKEYQNQKKFVEAILCFQEATRINPQLFPGWFYLGQSFYNSSPPQFEDALKAYGSALAVQPNHAQTLNNIGLIFFDTNKPKDALAVYEQALGILPNNPTILNNCGAALNELERADEALPVLEKALLFQPNDPEILNNLGVAHAKLRQTNEALAYFDKALVIRPTYDDARDNRNLLLNEI